jgi:hypothetical protein
VYLSLKTTHCGSESTTASSQATATMRFVRVDEQRTENGFRMARNLQIIMLAFFLFFKRIYFATGTAVGQKLY